MPFAAAAVGAGVTAGAGLIGGILQKGAIDAGKSQANAAIQQGITTATNQLSPWTTTGVPANTQEASLLGLNGQPAADAAMSTFQSSPGYQYQVQQGLRGVDASAASQGILRSGATIKGEETLGSNLANQDFGNYWNRLQQLSGNGLTAAGGIANAATGGATQMANVDTGAATADANIYGNIAKGFSTGANQLLQSNAVQNYLGGSGGGSGAPQMTGFAPALVQGTTTPQGFYAGQSPMYPNG